MTSLTSKPHASDRAWQERRRKEIIDESEATSEQMKGRNGVFHEITPICVGDPYRDPVSVSRSFAKNKPNFKAGKAPPPTDYLEHMREAEAEAEAKARQSSRDQRDELRPQKKRVNQSSSEKPIPPFRAGAGPASQMGSFIAAFSELDASMSRDQVKALIRKTKEETLKADKARIAAIRAKTGSSRRNFVTQPMKKGSYGTPGVLLSEIYLTSDPREERSRPKSAAAAVRSKKPSHEDHRRPFCSAMPGISGVFGRDDETFIHGPIDDGSRPPKVKRPASAHPFVPPGKCNDAVGSSYPHMPQTYPSSPRSARRRAAEASASKRESWRPSSASQTRPVRSVMLNRNALKHSFAVKGHP